MEDKFRGCCSLMPASSLRAERSNPAAHRLKGWIASPAARKDGVTSTVHLACRLRWLAAALSHHLLESGALLTALDPSLHMRESGKQFRCSLSTANYLRDIEVSDGESPANEVSASGAKRFIENGKGTPQCGNRRIDD